MNNEEKILELLARMQGDIASLVEGQSRLEQRLDRQEQRLDRQEQRLDRQEQRLDHQEQMLSRQEQILSRQGQMLSRQEQMINQLDERSQRTAVLLETEVNRKLNLLYEGHEAIMEYLDKLAPKSRVEVLESDVALLKDAVKLMRQEISELKKAQ